MASDDPTELNEVLSWDAMIGGRVVRVSISRDTIDDYLGAESTTPEERRKFVVHRRSVLGHCAAEALRNNPNATAIMLTLDDLPKFG